MPFVGNPLAGVCCSRRKTADWTLILLPHDESSDSSRGLFGESRYHVGVDIESNGDGGMAQAIRHHFGMNAGRKSQSGMGMAEIMQMDLGQSGLLHRRPKGFAHPLGMDELPVRARRSELHR